MCQKLKHGHMCMPLSASWSDYYASHDRDPSNLEVAPWVRQRQAKRAAAFVQPPTAMESNPQP